MGSEETEKPVELKHLDATWGHRVGFRDLDDELVIADFCPRGEQDAQLVLSSMTLSRAHVRALLPLLQQFVETGKLR